jgi:putative transposase
MVDRDLRDVSVVRQCELLDINRSSVYYNPADPSEYELELMGLLDKQYLRTPFYGSRKMAAWLRSQGYSVNRKRVQRLMRRMGIEAIYRRPRTTRSDSGHKVYPYLLRNLQIDKVNQVWATDITYIPTAHGFIYLVCIMDWHSRYVLSWRLSNTLETDFCVDALEEALRCEAPGIFNTDQGRQFTSEAFTSVLLNRGVQISMDSVGAYMDNIFIERLWQSVKYEEVYLKAYDSVAEARAGIGAYLRFYNNERLHEALGYQTPAQVFEIGRTQFHQTELSVTSHLVPA